MPRGKNCRETIFAAQLPRSYPHHGGNFERGKKCPLLWGEAIWEAFYETTWARVIESQKMPRDSGESIFAATHQDASQGSLGMEPLLEGLLRGGGSEANFLEVFFRRIPSGNVHTKATSKKSRPPSGNFRPNPPRTSEKSLQEFFSVTRLAGRSS